jgi:hypothetical protein
VEKSDKPGPERFDEESIAPRDDVHVHGAGGLRCPFCHDDVNIDATVPWVACEKCLARHHEACWGEAGRCGGCAHDVALAGRLRTGARSSGEPPRSLAALWALLAVGLLTVVVIVVGGLVTYARARSRAAAFVAAERAGAEEQRVRAEHARRRAELEAATSELEAAERAAIVRALENAAGPRRVEVDGGYAVVDAQAAWLYVDTALGGMVAGLGPAFLGAEGDTLDFAPREVSLTYALQKSDVVVPGAVTVFDGDGVAHELTLTPAQRDAIVAALSAPPGEVDIAALLAAQGYAR